MPTQLNICYKRLNEQQEKIPLSSQQVEEWDQNTTESTKDWQKK